jgi:hypothetical protein
MCTYVHICGRIYIHNTILQYPVAHEPVMRVDGKSIPKAKVNIFSNSAYSGK